MTQTTTPSTAAPKVHAAINQVKAAIGKEGISKGRRNNEQHYAFRGIDDVYNSLNPHLSDAGLNILPRMLKRECIERKTAAGKPLFNVVVEAEFDFISAEDGSTYTARTFGEAMDTADKATNKAMSAAFKYVCMQAFAIPTEGDNDADGTTHDVAGDQQQRAARPANGTANRAANGSRPAAAGAKANGTAPKGAAPATPAATLTPRQKLADLMVAEATAPIVKQLLDAWGVKTIDELDDVDAANGVKWVQEEAAKGGA